MTCGGQYLKTRTVNSLIATVMAASVNKFELKKSFMTYALKS